MNPFDPDEFVQSCIAALREDDPVGAIRDIVQRAVREPRSVEQTVTIPLDPDDLPLLHQAEDLLIAQAVFPRGYQTGIHGHSVPAIIGVWAGYEDNLLYERVDGGLRARAVERVGAGEVLVLEADGVHDVHTPPTTWSGAIHVYLGDITAIERDFWTSKDSPPVPFDMKQHNGRWDEVALATGLLKVPAESVRNVEE